MQRRFYYDSIFKSTIELLSSNYIEAESIERVNMKNFISKISTENDIINIPRIFRLNVWMCKMFNATLPFNAFLGWCGFLFSISAMPLLNRLLKRCMSLRMVDWSVAMNFNAFWTMYSRCTWATSKSAGRHLHKRPFMGMINVPFNTCKTNHTPYTLHSTQFLIEIAHLIELWPSAAMNLH